MANNLSGFYLTQPALFTDSVSAATGTRAAPTAITEGMDLAGAHGFRVIVSATNAGTGATLTGGTMRAWVLDPTVGSWSRVPDNDFTISSGTGLQSSADFEVTVPYGRVVFQASSVTTSDSAGCVCQIAAFLHGANR